MHSTKLIKMLKLLDDQEFKQFGQFIKSPYFNTNKRSIAFYGYLKKHYPAFDSPKLERETVFKYLFPKWVYNYKVLSTFTASFNRLIEKFLAQVAFEADTFAERKMLLAAYEKRQVPEWFDKQTDALITDLEALPYRDADLYRELYLLKHNQLNQPHVNRYQLMGEDFEEVNQYLDAFYMVEKLRLGAEIQARAKILTEEQHIRLLKEVSIIAQNEEWIAQHPLIQAYAAVVRLQQTDEEDDFQKLKAIFEKYRTALGLEEQKAILQILINYSVKKGNNGRIKFKAIGLELYKIGLKYGLLLVNNQISDGNYTNIAYLATSLKNYHWCTEFIENYAPFLEKDIRLDAQYLCSGYLNYRQKKYTVASNLLLSLDFKNAFYQFRAKHLLLKILFEEFLRDNSYFDVLILQANAFGKMIKRNETLHPSTINGYLAFVKQIRQLASYKMDVKYSKDWKIKVQESLLQKERVVSKQWLLEQLQKL